MKYLLDTNACIGLIRQEPAELRRKFERARSAGSELLVSAVAAFELWYGVAKSAKMEANARLVETFFAGPIGLLPFDDEDAKSAGRIRANLEVAGKMIGSYDLLMAGQAVRHKMTLVTANSREFGRVKELVWQDWSKR